MAGEGGGDVTLPPLDSARSLDEDESAWETFSGVQLKQFSNPQQIKRRLTENRRGISERYTLLETN